MSIDTYNNRMHYGLLDRVDIIPDLDWDTLNVKAGECISDVEMFTVPISSTKSWNDTSMTLPRSFSLPQHKNITNLQVAFGLNNDPDDTKTFREAFMYELIIGQKRYDYAPLSRFQWFANNQLEVAAFLKASKRRRTAAAKKIQFVGNEVEYRINDNPIGHHVLQGQCFCVRLMSAMPWTAKHDFKFVVFLKGVKARGIQ